MRIISVFGVLAAGVAIGASAVLAPLALKSTPSMGAAGWSQQAVQLARSVLALGGKTAEPDSGAASQTSASTTSPAPGYDAKTMDYLAHPAPSTAGKRADARIVETPWTTQVAVAPEAATPRRQTSSKPTSDEQRRTLVLDLQQELKRVGCYEGEPNGQWGAASKRAMAAFTDRVNASLPFEQPDFILLTLVQGHGGRACGKSCPSGQGLADNGHCTPNAILARAERAKAPEPKAGKGEELKAKSVEPPRASIASAWTTQTVRSPSETGALPLPNAVAIAVPAPVPAVRPPAKRETTVAAAEVIVRSAPPLPGRMTIGGPLPSPVAPEPKSVSPGRVAAADLAALSKARSEPVTVSEPAEPEPKIQRREKKPAQPAVRNDEPSHPSVRPKRASEPTIVHRPPPPPKTYYPRTADSTAGMSKSRRLVYELFQRPDRN